MAKTTVPPHVKSDPRFQTLVAVLKSDAKALVAFNRLEPATTDEDPRVQELVDAGFSRDEAVAALSDAPTEAPAPKAPQTSKEKAEALVERKGFAYTKGRVYVTEATIEAQARVMRSGKPEVVDSSGVGRTTAVLVYKEESGDVALQNLTAKTD